MRRAKTLALKITAALLCLTLCSCAGPKAPEDEARKIRAEYLSARSLTLTMNARADYGDRVYDFRMRWTGTDKTGELEILEPEAIRGLKAVLGEDGGRLEFDGAEFDTGGLFGDGLSPAEAAPLMIKAWKSGYISECARESRDGLSSVAVTTDISETICLRTWFDTETYLPIAAELSEAGRTALAIEFGDVILVNG